MTRLVQIGIIGLITALASPGFAGPGVGEPAPDFTEPDTASVNYSLSDFTGNVVLLNLWASW